MLFLECIENIQNISKEQIEKEIKNLNYVEKELKNNCNQSLKKHFSSSRPNIFNLYIIFLKNIALYIEVKEYGVVQKYKEKGYLSIAIIYKDEVESNRINSLLEKKFDSSKSIDMKLLYVSMTRALHRLTILYNDDITKSLVGD